MRKEKIMWAEMSKKSWYLERYRSCVKRLGHDSVCARVYYSAIRRIDRHNQTDAAETSLTPKGEP
jgi:hypothetical protein